MAAQQNVSSLKVKINNNDDTRLWRYSSNVDFEGLRSFILKTWNNDDFIAQYEDDEGDLITIASSQDLKDAFDFARAEKKKSLKIFVQNYVKQKRAQKQQQQQQQAENDQNDIDQKQESPASSKQFSSVREMVFDFLSNQEITTLLPEFFGLFISKLVEKGNTLKPEEITKMLYTEIEADTFNVITSHPLYCKYAAMAIPYIANRISFQQSLYPHFKSQTIKHWIHQLLQLLSQALQQNVTKFKDVVIDIEYPAMTDTGKVIHFGVECNLCGEYPVIGDRYKCSICSDWDCCTKCEPEHDHPLIKFKKASKLNENASFKGLAEIIKRLSGDERKENVEDAEDAESEEIDIYDEMVVDCICGAKMECIVAKKAYNKSNTVYCDECRVQSFNEMIYHCPNKYDEIHHRNGYDLCSKCAQKKVVNDTEKEKEDENDYEQEVVVEKEDILKEEEPKKEEEEQDVFEYLAQLNQIKNIMALEDGESDDVIKAMLVEHKGDISRVIPLLLQ